MKKTISQNFKEFVIKYSIGSILLLFIAIFFIIEPSLFTFRNLRNILSDSAPMLVISSAMAICMYSAYINFSAGTLSALAGILAGIFVQRTDTANRILSFLPTIPALIVVPIIIVLFYFLGRALGYLIDKIKMASWIFTLGISSFFLGLGYIFTTNTENYSAEITGFSNQFTQIGVGYIGTGPTFSIPFSVIIALIAVIGVRLNLRYNHSEICPKIKRSEKEISKKSLMHMFGISTALFSLGGILLAARSGSASPQLGFGITFDALAICFIGGFSLNGSKGSFRGIFLGSFLYVAMVYSSAYIGISQYLPHILRAIIIIAAVILEDNIRSKHEIQTQEEPAIGNSDSSDTD